MVVCVYLPRFELVVSCRGPAGAGGPAAGGGADGARRQRGRRPAGGGGLGGRRGQGREQGDGARRGARPLPRAGARAGRSRQGRRGVGGALCALESIGAAVEGARPGLAYFQTDGLLGLHGTPAGAIAAARVALGRPARIGAGPTRLCALAAAMAVRSRRPLVLEGEQARRWLSGRPVELLGFREETAALIEPLGRLGIRTLGDLERLGRPALADRFGGRGVLAHRLACCAGRPAAPAPRARAPAGVDGGRRRELGPGAQARHGCAGGAAAGPSRAPRADAARPVAVRRAAGAGEAGASGWCSARPSPTRSGSPWRCRRPCSRSRRRRRRSRLAVERFGPAASEQGALARSGSRGPRRAPARGDRADPHPRRQGRRPAGRLRGPRLARARAAGGARPDARRVSG